MSLVLNEAVSKAHRTVIRGTLCLCFLLIPALASQKAPTNRKEFRSLCLFYKIAKEAEAERKKIAESPPKSKTLEELDKEIDQVNAILVEFNESKSNVAVKINLDGDFFLVTNGPKRELAKLKLNALKNTLTRLETKIRQENEEVLKTYKEAINELDGARFGVVDEAKATTGGSGALYATAANRDNTCKGSDSAACNSYNTLAAGCSLVHDMFCLCIIGQSGRNEPQACGVQAGTGVTEWYTSTMTGNDQIGTNWAAISAHCDDVIPKAVFTKQSIHHAIETFEGLLGAGLTAQSSMASGQNYKWVLGASAVATGGSACSGATATSGTCVNYGTGTDTTRKENKWLKKFQAALKKLENQEEGRTRLLRLEARLSAYSTAIQNILIEANASMLETSGAPAASSSEATANPSTADHQSQQKLTHVESSTRKLPFLWSLTIHLL